MSYSRESHELLEKSFQELKSKVEHPYASMVGYLITCVPLEDAKRIAKLIEDLEGKK